MRRTKSSITQSHTPSNSQSIHKSSKYLPINTIVMPVPLHSTTEKSTSSSGQAAQNTSTTATQSVASSGQTEKTEQEKEAERLYEERMEEEYAKREGGA
jgi:hypothetical protein